jgi:hypothetical protein
MTGDDEQDPQLASVEKFLIKYTLPSSSQSVMPSKESCEASVASYKRNALQGQALKKIHIRGK